MVSRRILHQRSARHRPSEHRYCLSSRHYFFEPSLWLRPHVVYPDQSLVEAETWYRSSPSILANDCSFLRKGMLTSGVLAAEVQQTCLMVILLFGKQLYGVSFNCLSRRQIFNVFHVSGCSCTLHSICSWERCRKNGKYTSRFIPLLCRRTFAM